MANFLAAACAGVMPLAVMVTARELGATAPVLEIVNSHAARFSPDEDVISIGGHTSAVPLKVTPGVVEVSSIDRSRCGRCAHQDERETERQKRCRELPHDVLTSSKTAAGNARGSAWTWSFAASGLRPSRRERPGLGLDLELRCQRPAAASWLAVV